MDIFSQVFDMRGFTFVSDQVRLPTKKKKKKKERSVTSDTHAVYMYLHTYVYTSW